MIIEAFLEWLETARTNDRVRAATALGEAFLRPDLQGRDRQTARLAMTYLLDDPSPRVRLSLAQAISHSCDIPREIVIPLANDQPEVANCVIKNSPVLGDMDLVDLAARGDDMTRALIASRPVVTPGVAAALAEIGEETDVVLLLENPGASISRTTLIRMAERHGDSAEIRSLLLVRTDLPTQARHMLVEHVSTALGSFMLVQATVGTRRIERIKREACDSATVTIAGNASIKEMPVLVEHLRKSGKLTPAFLMHCLCVGKIDFFAAAIVNLSGLAERRVVSLLGDGRHHAIRALYEAAGLARDISEVFVEATMLWRNERRKSSFANSDTLFCQLERKYRDLADRQGAVGELLELVERLHISDRRQSARSYAGSTTLVAA